MGSEVACDVKGELDDSGCVQDDTTQISELSLMDMPDDVLLHILKCCPVPERKALAYCCTRLCHMVQERLLWRHVDARSEPCSRARLRWYLDNTLQEDTRTLLLTGFAKEGCLGFVNVRREVGEQAKCLDSNSHWDTAEHLAQQSPAEASAPQQQRKLFPPRGYSRDYWFSRCFGMPMWSDLEQGRGGEEACVGPQFSLSQELLRQLAATCPQLSTLALEYCNIDCKDTNLCDFPKTLKRLSLRGSRCYNIAMDKTFLFRINFLMPHLQSLELSECEWMDPATLLPLSKLAELTELQMRDCSKLTEFVAYASLTARYGFKALKSLDLRGSPVGDSEISALGWLPSLERLWLARTYAASALRRPASHAHYMDDPVVQHVQLHPWEEMEPHLLRVRPNTTYYYYDDVAMEINEREREGLKRKPEEIESEEVNRSPKRIREDDYYKRCDDFIEQRSRLLMSIKDSSHMNKLKRKLLDRDNVNVQPSTSRGDDSANDPKMKDLDEDSETAEPSTKDGLEKKGKSKNDSQNARSSKSDDNQDDNDDDDYDGNQNPIRVSAEPEKTLVIEISLKDGTQTRSLVNLHALGRRVDDILSDTLRGIGERESSTCAHCHRENPASAEKSAKEGIPENAGIPNVGDDNEGIPDVGDDNAGIPNVGDDNAGIPNVVDGNAGIPNVVDDNVELPCVGNENVEIPNEGNGNADIPNGNENGENQDQPNDNGDDPLIQNRNNGANGAPPPLILGQNGDPLADCLKIEEILNYSEERSGDHGKVIVFAKRAKTQPTPAVGPQPNDGLDNRLMIINCNWDQARRQRRQVKMRLHAEAQAQARAHGQAQAQGQVQAQVNEGASTSRDNPAPRVEHPVDYRIEPQHHVLYVNVGRHTSTYRFPRDFVAPEFPGIRGLNVERQHVDSSALVTDFAIRRFGRADGEDVNIIHLGLNGPEAVAGQDPGTRPDRSTLRFLSVNGYRNITDRSLAHLATAAPDLEHVDFSDTSVSDAGAETFRGLRPDCTLIYSKFTEEEE